MSNRARKQWMFLAACIAFVVLINLRMSYESARMDRLLDERQEEAERRLEEAKSRYEQAIDERSLD